MLSFSIFRAAMFAEPTVTKIEEVVRLVHVSRTDISVGLCRSIRLEDVSCNQFPSSFRTGTCALAERTSPHSKREEEKLVPLVVLGKTDRQECLSYLTNQSAPGARCFHQAYGYSHSATVAKDLHLNGVADLMLVEHSI
jgi:hypothetical protein